MAKKPTKRKLLKFDNPFKLCLDILESNFITNPDKLDADSSKFMTLLFDRLNRFPQTSEDTLKPAPTPSTPAEDQLDASMAEAS